MRKAYIKGILDLIFSNELSRDLTGYQDMDPNWLINFPVNNKLNNIMQDLRMKSVNNILIYGGILDKKNWWYDYWGMDDLLDIFNKFSFFISIVGEVDESGQTFRAAVTVKNYDIVDMYIDLDKKDIYLIKNGTRQW